MQKPQAKIEIGLKPQKKPKFLGKNHQAKAKIGAVNHYAKPRPRSEHPTQTENDNTRPDRDGYLLGLMKWPRNGFVEMSFF